MPYWHVLFIAFLFRIIHSTNVVPYFPYHPYYHFSNYQQHYLSFPHPAGNTAIKTYHPLHINEKSITTKIVNGVQAEKGEFPFAAGFHVWVNPSQGVVVQCAGSLIDKNHVLTAGHCIYDHRKNAALTKIRMNTLEFPDVKDPDAVIRGVKSYTIHPDYNPKISNENDIAILTLDYPVPDHLKPVKLPPFGTADDAFDTLNATSIGWGSTDPPRPSSSPILLKLTSLYIVDNAECGVRIYGKTIPPTQICASTRGLGSPCGGDSGGPLLVDGVQVGVASYVKDCTSEDTTSVYSRITSYRQWIQDVLNNFYGEDMAAASSTTSCPEGNNEKHQIPERSIDRHFKPAHKGENNNQFYVLV